MRWITRERPKIDRVACPWLISRFIDPEAEFIFVPPTEIAEAKELDAVPYDVHGVELTYEGDLCSFDAFLKEYNLDEPELRYLALIVRERTPTDTISRPRALAYSRSPSVFLTCTSVMIRPSYGTDLSFMMPCIDG